METWRQLPLFPGLFIGPDNVPFRDHSTQHLRVERAETDALYRSERRRWLGAFLEGTFDMLIAPRGWRVVGVNLVSNERGWAVYLRAVDHGGRLWESRQWEATRVKACRSFRFLARNGLLTWQPKERG